MAKIQDFTTGKDFTPKKLDKELKAAIRSGGLKGLRENQETLNAIAKKRQSSIRSGEYDSYRRKADYEEVLKSNKSLDEKGKKHVKELFEHWSKPPEPKKELKPVAKKVVKKKPTRKRVLTRSLSEILGKNTDSTVGKPYAPAVFQGGINKTPSSPTSGLGSGRSSSIKRPKLMR